MLKITSHRGVIEPIYFHDELPHSVCRKANLTAFRSLSRNKHRPTGITNKCLLCYTRFKDTVKTIRKNILIYMNELYFLLWPLHRSIAFTDKSVKKKFRNYFVYLKEMKVGSVESNQLLINSLLAGPFCFGSLAKETRLLLAPAPAPY